MAKHLLLSAQASRTEHNIYADKSALVLEWLLLIGSQKDSFSVREVSRDRDVSVGLVQRIFAQLIYQGYLVTDGVRTSKTFRLKKPQLLLEDWLRHYNVVKKCKMWSYRSGLPSRDQIMQLIQKAHLPVSFALHTAANLMGMGNTNLQTVEFYLRELKSKPIIEEKLLLEPQERGYEVLIIAPYYKSMLEADVNSSPLLTVLDLYHFPLRGHEQAQFMLENMPSLQHLHKNLDDYANRSRTRR